MHATFTQAWISVNPTATGGRGVRIGVEIDEPPQTIACDIYLRVGQHKWKVGNLVLRPKEKTP